MVYQPLCGELPFRVDSMADLMFKPHRDITQIRLVLGKKAPSTLPVLDKILEKTPENRYQTGGEFALHLRGYLKKIKNK